MAFELTRQIEKHLVNDHINGRPQFLAAQPAAFSHDCRVDLHIPVQRGGIVCGINLVPPSNSI